MTTHATPPRAPLGGPDRAELRAGLAVARRWAGLLVVVFAAVLTLGACGAGPSAQTGQEVPAVNGAQSTGGPIVVSDAMIAMPSGSGGYAPGASAPLGMWIVNRGAQPDRLLSASSPAATTVTVSGDLSLQPGATVAVTAAAPQRPNASPTEPDGQQVQDAQMTLVGLRQDLQPGQDYPITLLFEHAGPITVTVPMGSPTEG